MIEIITNQKTVIARKEHRCSYCYGKIEIGEKYHYAVYKYDDIYAWKSHLRCDLISSELRMIDSSDEGVTSEDFYEIIKNKFHEIQTTEDYDIPDFQGRLDIVCNYYLKTNKL